MNDTEHTLTIGRLLAVTAVSVGLWLPLIAAVRWLA
jgi:hypothetical protein